MSDTFTCPCCGKVSRNEADLAQGYCGACHWWTGDPTLGPPHFEEPCEARLASLLREWHASG